MATKKKAVKKKKTVNTITAGATGFIVLEDYSYGATTPKYSVSGSDIHSTLDKAKACCGGDSDAVLEVTLVAIHKNITTYAKQPDFNGLKFGDR